MKTEKLLPPCVARRRESLFGARKILLTLNIAGVSESLLIPPRTHGFRRSHGSSTLRFIAGIYRRCSLRSRITLPINFAAKNMDKKGGTIHFRGILTKSETFTDLFWSKPKWKCGRKQALINCSSTINNTKKRPNFSCVQFHCFYSNSFINAHVMDLHAAMFSYTFLSTDHASNRRKSIVPSNDMTLLRKNTQIIALLERRLKRLDEHHLVSLKMRRDLS